ncbi:MAG: type I-MYXAN CRISPR-associated protein Cas6/Cmx6 [Hydrogenophilaceae bacterium]|nr:type I-MYXAN CRISPR-associated protein Cas6/Cmx6 [Hydrogenophilaceae bacterium]
MRMYNPEWEAIKDFNYQASVAEVQFDLVGLEIPADHGYPLYRELCRHLPWLADTPEAGVQSVHGAPSGRNANLVINRRVKLVLRVPVARVKDVEALVGKTIDPGAGPITIGALKVRQLTPFQTLYAHFAAMGTEDEAEFLTRAKAELEAMGIQCGLICGKKRHLTTPEGQVMGYSLMLYDLTLLQSMQLIEKGLGQYRAYGCGIFVPHKSIKEVAAG